LDKKFKAVGNIFFYLYLCSFLTMSIISLFCWFRSKYIFLLIFSLMPIFLLVIQVNTHPLATVYFDSDFIYEKGQTKIINKIPWSLVVEAGIGEHPRGSSNGFNIYFSTRRLSVTERTHIFDLVKDKNVILFRLNPKTYEFLINNYKGEIIYSESTKRIKYIRGKK